MGATDVLVLIQVMFVFDCCVLLVNCQHLNVIFPQLEKLAQPDRKDIAKDTLTIPLVSNDVESTSLKLQQLQAKLGQLEGLVRSLSNDGSSAKSERVETSSPPPLAPSTKEPPTTARPKNAPPNPPQDFTNLFSDLGGGNGIAVDESQINALRSEIEALEKQLGRRHDGNSHNTFDNLPVTEPPTMFHFHQQQNVPHQSLFDRDSQVAANPNFNREAPQFRSNEPANREAEFNILHQLWNQPGGAPAASDTQSVTRADGEQPLSPRLHNKPFLSANNYNYPLYGSGYGIAPQKRPEIFGSKFPYGGDSRPQSSDVTYNVDTKPELRPLKYGGNSQDFNYNDYQNYGAGNSHQGNTQDYFEMGNTLQGNVQNGNKVGLGTQNSLNNVSGGKGGVILQFVLEVMRMIASGNGVGLIGVLLRLPVVILTNFVQSVGSSIATNGLRGIISRGIIPLVVLVGANLLIIFLTWFMWDDGSTASLIAAQGLLAAQGLAAPPQNM